MQVYCKFLTTPTTEICFFAKGILYYFCNALKNNISIIMSMQIINIFKIINIKNHHGHLFRLRVFIIRIHAGLKYISVIQTGKSVMTVKIVRFLL